MINLVSLALVLTSLLSAQVLSPSPERPHNQKEDVILKEGHRVVVVETYDQGGQHNTKVSISPEKKGEEELGDFLKDRVKEASHVLPKFGQGISQEAGPDGDTDGTRYVPSELVCDSLGKCTHKIARAVGKAKEKVAEAAQEVVTAKRESGKEAARGVAREAKELGKKVEGGYEHVKEAASRKAHEAKETIEDAYEKGKEAAAEKAHEVNKRAKEAIEDAYEKGKEAAAGKVHEVKERAKESIDKAKGGAKTAKDTSKTIVKDVERNVSEQWETSYNAAEKAKERSEEAKNRVSTYFHDAARSILVGEARNSMSSLLNLLGFTIAYGASVWVTFVSSYVLAGALPRHQFAVVQSKVYPVYFRAMAYSVGAALVGHLLGHGTRLFHSKAEIFQAYNLLLSIFLVLVNAVYLEPMATKAMFERLRMEKEEGRGREGSETTEQHREQEQVTSPSATPSAGATTQAGGAARVPDHEDRGRADSDERFVRLSARIKKLNSFSSLLNILALMALTWHLVYLAQRLHVTCD